MCKWMVLAVLGILLLAFGVSSFWYAVLNAVANHTVTGWLNLFEYALAIIVGIGLAVGGWCCCSWTANWTGMGMETKKRRRR